VLRCIFKHFRLFSNHFISFPTISTTLATFSYTLSLSTICFTLPFYFTIFLLVHGLFFILGDEGVATLEGGTWSSGPWPTPPAISRDCQVILVDTRVHVRSQTYYHHSCTRRTVALSVWPYPSGDESLIRFTPAISGHETTAFIYSFSGLFKFFTLENDTQQGNSLPWRVG
jgi:hypothetical protein